jgi:hypothetical protein
MKLPPPVNLPEGGAPAERLDMAFRKGSDGSQGSARTGRSEREAPAGKAALREKATLRSVSNFISSVGLVAVIMAYFIIQRRSL